MGCCCGKKPIQQPPKNGQVIEEVYQKPAVRQEEVVQQRYEEKEEVVIQAVEQPRKAPEVKASAPPPPPAEKYTLSDVDKINGAQKLTDKEKINLFRAILILDPKGRKVTQVIAVISYGIVVNTQNAEGQTICMKLIFHDEELLPANGSESEQQRIFNKEVEVMKRADHNCVLKYKSHTIDNGKSLNSTALSKYGSDQILFVDFQDNIKCSLQDHINQIHKSGNHLNDRQFLLFAQDMILGMEYLHKIKCLSRHLHPDRLLVSSDEKRQNIKFCDFLDGNLQERNDKVKNYNINKLKQNVKLQSPQIQYFLKENSSKAVVNESSEIWTMGAILSQIAEVEQNRFDEFSSIQNNQGFVGDDHLAKLDQQKNILMKSIVQYDPKQQKAAIISQSRVQAGASDPSSGRIEFPGSIYLKEDSNSLLVQILDRDENERNMNQIRAHINYLAFKYHLDAIQSRQEPDYMKGKRLEKAPEKSTMKDIEQQLKSDSNNAKLQYSMAQCYFEYDKSSNSKALEHIKKAIQLDSTNGKYYNLYGAVLERELMIDQAYEAFKTSTEKDPTFSLPHHNLGYLNQKVLQNPNEAIINYQQALKIDNTNQSSMFNLALALKDQNKAVEALKYYEQYLKSNQKDSQIYNNLGVLIGQYPELREVENTEIRDPIQMFEKALELNKDDVCAMVNLSQALLNDDSGNQMNYERVRTTLNYAKKISPKYALTYYVLGLAEMQNSNNPDWQAAVDYFNQALIHYPAFSLAAYQIGLIYYEIDTLNKDIQEVIQQYERAIIYDPHNFLAYYSLALSQEQILKSTTDQTLISKLRTKAIANYRKTLVINPTYVEALNNLGVLIKQIAIMEQKLKKNTKEFEIVEYYLKQAESLAPTNKVVVDNLQKLYVDLKQDDLAQQSHIKSTLVGEE